MQYLFTMPSPLSGAASFSHQLQHKGAKKISGLQDRLDAGISKVTALADSCPLPGEQPRAHITPLALGGRDRPRASLLEKAGGRHRLSMRHQAVAKAAEEKMSSSEMP